MSRIIYTLSPEYVPGIQKHAAPGVQGRQAADLRRTDKPLVPGQFLYRRLRTGKHGGINDPLMRPGRLPQSLRQSHSQQKVMGRQKLSRLFMKPLVHFVLLTARTVPIAAAAGNNMGSAAVGALINQRAKGTIAAIGDVPHGFFMDGGHLVSVTGQILRTV